MRSVHPTEETVRDPHGLDDQKQRQIKSVQDPLGLYDQKQRQIKSVAYKNVKCGIDGDGY